MKDEAALNSFLQDEVNLNQTRYDNAQGPVENPQESPEG